MPSVTLFVQMLGFFVTHLSLITVTTVSDFVRPAWESKFQLKLWMSCSKRHLSDYLL